MSWESNDLAVRAWERDRRFRNRKHFKEAVKGYIRKEFEFWGTESTVIQMLSEKMFAKIENWGEEDMDFYSLDCAIYNIYETWRYG